MCWTIKKEDKAISESVVIEAALWQVACEVLTESCGCVQNKE